MKLARTLVVCLAAAAAPAALAQTWELGGGLGGSFTTSKDVFLPTEKASTKIAPGVAASAWLTSSGNSRWSGELHYTYESGKLEVSQSSTKAQFDAQSHGINYDLQWHGAPSTAPSRFYIAAGAGIKVYRGTGTEGATQPLSRFLLLTKTQEVQGMISVGAGLKTKIGPNWQLRLDVHDYMTPVPKEVLQPNVGVRVDGWFHNIVPMVGLSWTK